MIGHIRTWLFLGFLALASLAMASCSSLDLTGQPDYDDLRFDEPISWPEPDVVSFQLENGIRFLLIEDHELPLVRVEVMVKSGQFQAPRGQEGLADLTGTALRSGGSENHPSDALNRLLADKAAEINTSFNFISGSASLDVLSQDFRELLPVFVDLLHRPAFPQSKIALAKQQLRTEIARRNDQQSSLAMRTYKRLIYGPDSVYAREPQYKTVQAIDRQDIVSFHQQAYQGKKMIVGLVGDFEVEKVKPLLKQEFSAFPPGQRQTIDLPSVQEKSDSSLNVVGKQDVNQSYILMGHLGGFRQNPDFAALQVMNKVLSGGFSGRLFEKVRTQMGLAYSVFGRYGCEFYYPGMFFVGLKTKTPATAKAIRVVREELEKLQQGVGTQELNQAKEQFFNSLVFRYDEATEILERRMFYAYRQMDPESFTQLVEEIREVTAEDVARVAREYLQPGSLQVLAVGEKDKLIKQLEAFGSVTVLPQP